MVRPRPLLFAHRGAAAELPENTLPSFARALELGAYALEMDLHLTRDGHVVVAHDPDGERLAGVAAEIRRSDLAAVQAWDVGGPRLGGRGFRIPTLDEVLAAFPGVLLNVDVKQREPPMVEPLLALLRRRRATDRVIIASFSAATLRAVRRLGYPGPTALGRADVLRLIATPLWALRIAPPPGRAAQLPVRAGPLDLSAPWLIARCHAIGLAVDYWTVNDAAQAAELLARGADGIMTDDPGRIAPVFAAY